MAGNDGDLLKQATQAMMARYESEKHISLRIGPHTEHDELFDFQHDITTLCLQRCSLLLTPLCRGLVPHPHAFFLFKSHVPYGPRT